MIIIVKINPENSSIPVRIIFRRMMKNESIMELGLASPQIHFDCSLQRKRIRIDLDEEVSAGLLYLLHPDIA